MPSININATVTVDLITKATDLLSFPFQVLDDNSNAVNFSGYTGAKMTVKDNELLNEIISFSSTGSTFSGNTYSIDISNRNVGAFTINCNSLAIQADEYQYDFQIYNGNGAKTTIMQGKFIVMDSITN